jgi:hypothetical protein
MHQLPSDELKMHMMRPHQKLNPLLCYTATARCDSGLVLGFLVQGELGGGTNTPASRCVQLCRVCMQCSRVDICIEHLQQSAYPYQRLISVRMSRR